MISALYPLYNKNSIRFKSLLNILSGKKFKSSFPIKVNRKLPAFIERRKALHSGKNSEKLNHKKHELFKISQGFERIEECIFYSLNGIIHMATLPKSDN